MYYYRTELQLFTLYEQMIRPGSKRTGIDNFLQRKDGERFELPAADVSAFTRRKLM
jgi:hypothetical protein